MKHVVIKLQNGLGVRVIKSMGSILVDELLGSLHNLETKKLQCAHTQKHWCQHGSGKHSHQLELIKPKPPQHVNWLNWIIY